MGAPGAALRSGPWALVVLLSVACSLAAGQPFPNLNANVKLTTDVTALAQDGQYITVSNPLQHGMVSQALLLHAHS